MVDQQTPPVRSEEELERDDAASPETQARRDDAGDLDVEANRAAQADTPAPAAEAPAAPAPAADAPAAPAPAAPASSAPDPALFDSDTSKGYQDRWLVIQTEFVDSPKDAVKKAEQLVGEVMTELTESFSRQRRSLEGGWSKNDDASTEDLRQAIRRYRSFFNRLLAI